MRAPQTMHMLIEVHHLETIELSRNLLDLLLLIVWNVLNTRRIPLDVFTSSLLVLSTSFDRTTRYFAVVDVLNSVVPHGACFDLGSTHADELLVVYELFVPPYAAEWTATFLSHQHSPRGHPAAASSFRLADICFSPCFVPGTIAQDNAG